MKFNYFGLLLALVSKSMAWNHVTGEELLQRGNGRILIACMHPGCWRDSC
jgi:hypothetical protein